MTVYIIICNGTHEEFYFVHKHMEKSRNDGFKLDLLDDNMQIAVKNPFQR